MAVRIVDGFDSYKDATINPGGLQGRWRTSSAVSVPIDLDMTTGRFGGQAFRWNQTARWLLRDFSPTPQAGFGFAFRLTGNMSDLLTNASLCYLGVPNQSSNQQVGVALSADGAVHVVNADNPTASVVRASSTPGVVVIDTWHYIEVYATCSTTTGSVSVYIDGSLVVSASSIDTSTGLPTSTSFGYVGIGCGRGGASGGVVAEVDDFFYSDDTVRIGEARVSTLKPTSDVGPQDWIASTGTDRSAMVKDPLYQTVKYIEAVSSGNTSMFEHSDLPFLPNKIYAVSVKSLAGKTDATTRTTRMPVRVGTGGPISEGTDFTMPATPALFERCMSLNPETSLPWLPWQVNDLQAGVKVSL